jgi:hypothetical protein
VVHPLAFMASMAGTRRRPSLQCASSCDLSQPSNGAALSSVRPPRTRVAYCAHVLVYVGIVIPQMLNFRAGPEPLGSLLPAPVWANDPVRRPKSSVEHFRRLWALSSPRTRATRAAVLLLSLLGGYTLLLHASRWLLPGAASLSPLSSPIHVDVTRVARPAAHTNLTHVIVVPCNAIFLGTRAEERGDDESWTLHDYQRGRGRPASFWRHILEGARLVQADPHGLLVFSG